MVAPAADGGRASVVGSISGASIATIAGAGATVAINELEALLSEDASMLETAVHWLKGGKGELR